MIAICAAVDGPDPDDLPVTVLRGKVRLAEDDSVLLEGFDPPLERDLLRWRCLQEGGKLPWLTIADGERWVRALPGNIIGSRLWAEEAVTPPSPPPPPYSQPRLPGRDW